MGVSGAQGAQSSVCRCRPVFFFQAEDGIRDLTVTGVQTCALPISSTCPNVAPSSVESRRVTLEQEIGGAVVPPTVHDTIADPLCSTAPSEGAVMPKDRKSVV